MVDPGTATLIGTGLNIVGGLFSQSSARTAYQHRYQDTVKDLKKAGLNPALAYGQNPGGGAQTHDFGDIGSQSVSASQAAAAAQQAKANAEKTKAETRVLNAQAENLITRSGLINENLVSQGHLLTNTAALRGFQKDYARDSMTSRLNTAKSTAELAQLRAELAGLSLPEARAYAKYYRGPIGRAEPYINTAKGVADEIIKAIRGTAGAERDRALRDLMNRTPRRYR